MRLCKQDGDALAFADSKLVKCGRDAIRRDDRLRRR
jgi:hypothetical protein